MARNNISIESREQAYRLIFTILISLLVLIPIGCATPYKPKGAMGGFEEQALGNGKFHINVRGNGYTSVGTVEEYFYRRAEELTKENGYDGYVVIELKSGHEPWALGPRPTARGIIQCYTGKPPQPKGMPSQGRKESTKIGTAWILSKGYVATCYHIVDNADEIFLIDPNGKKYLAAVALKDRNNDIALLYVENAKDLPAGIPLAKAQEKSGAKVFTVGYPHPTIMGAASKLTDGIVSSPTGLLDDPRFYQITVPLQAGNSGGPLLDMEGEAVGIATSKLNAQKMLQFTGDLPENVNYALKIQYLSLLTEGLPTLRESVEELPRKHGDLEELASRIKNSVWIVVGKSR